MCVCVCEFELIDSLFIQIPAMSHDSHHHPVKLPSLFHASPSKHSSVLDSPTRTRRAASGKVRKSGRRADREESLVMFSLSLSLSHSDQSRALPESDTPVASHVVLPDIVSVKVLV